LRASATVLRDQASELRGLTGDLGVSHWSARESELLLQGCASLETLAAHLDTAAGCYRLAQVLLDTADRALRYLDQQIESARIAVQEAAARLSHVGTLIGETGEELLHKVRIGDGADIEQITASEERLRSQLAILESRRAAIQQAARNLDPLDPSSIRILDSAMAKTT
jgi:hypothetical protein